MKVCEKCGDEIAGRDGDNRCRKCESKPRKGARQSRRQMDGVMASLGLTKVRGALGGVYYE